MWNFVGKGEVNIMVWWLNQIREPITGMTADR